MMLNVNQRIGLVVGLGWLLLTGCSSLSQQHAILAHQPAGMGGQAAGQLLYNGFDEEQHDGLYCYLLWSEPVRLMTEPPDEQWFDKVFLQPVKGLSSGYIYWPVLQTNPRVEAGIKRQRKWSVLIGQYHYQRARFILERLNWHTGVQPILVMGFYPLGTLARKLVERPHPVYAVELGQFQPQQRSWLVQQLIGQILTQRLTVVKNKWSRAWVSDMLQIKEQQLVVLHQVTIH